MSSNTVTNKVFRRSPQAGSITLDGNRCARVLGKFVFACLLALVVVVAIPYGAVEPWWISCYEVAVFGLAALWVIERLITRSWALAEKRLLAPIAALICFVFLQTIALPGLSGM